MVENGRTYEQSIMNSLRRIMRAVDVYSRKLNTEFGLTTPQLLCLDIMAKSKNMILKDLAKAVNLSESTVNGIADRLEAKLYVERQRSSLDRRKVFLVVTPAGHAILQRTPAFFQDRLSASLSLMSEAEQQAMTESLEHIAALMETEKWMQPQALT